MINVDISNVWGQLDLPELLAMEREVEAAFTALWERSGPGSEALGWLDPETTENITRLQSTAERIRKDSDVCVVIGAGGSCTGARAAIEALQGRNRNGGKKKGDPVVLFAGDDLSTRCRNKLMGQLEGKDVSLIAVSGSGDALEPAIAFRALRWMLERKYGSDEAKKRICAVTAAAGPLAQMAAEEGWECFRIPENVGDGFSVLTAAGLLPMAVAGLDITEVLEGAARAKEAYAEHSFENPVWLYAAVRNLLYRNGKAIELFSLFDPELRALGCWWQQLFAQAEGKDGKGIFPVSAVLPGDLYSLGQMIREGERNLFETMVRFDPPEAKVTIGGDWKDLDELNYLEGKTLDWVEEAVFQGIQAAHADGGVGVITLECGRCDARTMGELFFFLQLCCAVSAGVLGVDPVSRRGMEAYQRGLFALLGKPGCEN